LASFLVGARGVLLKGDSFGLAALDDDIVTIATIAGLDVRLDLHVLDSFRGVGEEMSVGRVGERVRTIHL
jgi:hypothetical protein